MFRIQTLYTCIYILIDTHLYIVLVHVHVHVLYYIYIYNVSSVKGVWSHWPLPHTM